MRYQQPDDPARGEQASPARSGDVGIDKLPLLAASGPAAVIDLTALAGAGTSGTSPPVTPDHLIAWEAENGAIEAGEVVLLRSDWDDRYRAGSDGSAYSTDVLSGTRPGWPAPTAEAIEWLHGRGVRCVGIDGPSIGAAEDGGPTHLAGLIRGMTFADGLTGLRSLPPRGAWFRLVGGTGGPGRAIAVLPADRQQLAEGT